MKQYTDIVHKHIPSGNGTEAKDYKPPVAVR
jgi:hypothetical protein